MDCIGWCKEQINNVQADKNNQIPYMLIILLTSLMMQKFLYDDKFLSGIQDEKLRIILKDAIFSLPLYVFYGMIVFYLWFY
jgi:hypothetical protein